MFDSAVTPVRPMAAGCDGAVSCNAITSCDGVNSLLDSNLEFRGEHWLGNVPAAFPVPASAASMLTFGFKVFSSSV